MALICVGLAVGATALALSEHTLVNLAVLAMAVGFVGPIWYRWIHGQLDWFEPIHVFGGIYFLYFGLGSLWVVNDPHAMGYDANLADFIPQSVLYCLLGQWAMLFAYFGVSRKETEREVTASSPGEWPRGWLFLASLAGAGFVGYVAQAMVERSVRVASGVLTGISPITQLSPLFLFAWGMAWLIFYSGRSTFIQRVLLFGGMVPAALFILWATVSDKSLIMVMGGIPVIARWYGKRRIPWTILIVMFLVLIFIVFPLYNTYRWSDAHASNAERLENTYRTVQTWGADTYMRWSLDAFKFRTSLVNSVAVVVRDTGRWVPYAQGETIFMPALVSVVPRYLWPDKPILTLGQEFGRIFRVTDYWSRDTYIAITMPGELYWNFHLPGVVVGMALMGLTMSWLFRTFGGRGTSDPMRTAIMILIVVQLSHFHGSIAMDVVLFSRLLVLLMVIRWLGRRMELIELRDEKGAVVGG
jgi:hypothetical protein